MENSFTQDFENSETTRRRFLKLLISIGSALLGLVLGIPFIRSLIVQKSQEKNLGWVKVADISSLPDNQPFRVKYLAVSEDAYLRKTLLHVVWAVKHSPSDITVFSPICTHAGCYYNWDSQTGRFECPCHESVFSINGKVLAGPAPRQLDTLRTKIENGELFVVWQEFEAGIPQKIPV